MESQPDACKWGNLAHAPESVMTVEKVVSVVGGRETDREKLIWTPP